MWQSKGSKSLMHLHIKLVTAIDLPYISWESLFRQDHYDV